MTKKNTIISIVLKSIVIVAALVGTFLSYWAGRNSFMGGTSVFLYFTIQSNIALAITCLVGLVLIILKKNISRTLNVLKFVATTSITLTGVVFCLVLAPTLGAGAWNVQNILTHVVVPLASIVDFFVICKNANLRKRDTLFTIIPPIAYAIFASIGYLCKLEFSPHTYYPYFFLNWGSPAGAFGFTDALPFMGVMYWIILIAAFLVGMGFLYLFFVKLVQKKVK